LFYDSTNLIKQLFFLTSLIARDDILFSLARDLNPEEGELFFSI